MSYPQTHPRRRERDSLSRNQIHDTTLLLCHCSLKCVAAGDGSTIRIKKEGRHPKARGSGNATTHSIWIGTVDLDNLFRYIIYERSANLGICTPNGVTIPREADSIEAPVVDE